MPGGLIGIQIGEPKLAPVLLPITRRVHGAIYILSRQKLVTRLSIKYPVQSGLDAPAPSINTAIE
jgi:hypothetical protein